MLTCSCQILSLYITYESESPDQDTRVRWLGCPKHTTGATSGPKPHEATKCRAAVLQNHQPQAEERPHTPVRGEGSTASRTTMPAKARQMATLAWDTRASRRGELTAKATGQAAHTVMPACPAPSDWPSWDDFYDKKAPEEPPLQDGAPKAGGSVGVCSGHGCGWWEGMTSTLSAGAGLVMHSPNRNL